MKKQTTSFFTRAGLLFKQLWKMICNHWLLKIICVVMAVLLWGIIISQDDSILRRRTFTDVDITVSSSSISSLRSSGLIITEGLENLPRVTLDVNVPQKNFQSVTASNYSVRLDLTGIKRAGEFDVPVTYSNSANYGEVVGISTTSVHVKVEEYAARTRIPVNVEYIGEMPEGYYAEPSKADPGVVAISGPRSVVYKVSYCKAVIDRSALEGRVSSGLVAVPIKLYDALGNEINDNTITVTVAGQSTTIDSVIVEQNIYKLFTLPVTTDSILSGSVAEGYEIRSITLQPDHVTFALPAEKCSETVLYAGPVDLRNAPKDDVTRTCTVIRPEGCVYVDHGVITVTVDVEPVEAGDQQ